MKTFCAADHWDICNTTYRTAIVHTEGAIGKLQ